MGNKSAAKPSLARLLRLAEAKNAGGALFAHAIIWLLATTFYITQNRGTADPTLFALPAGLGILSLWTLWVGLEMAREYRPIKPIAALTSLVWPLLAGFYFARRGTDIVLAASDDVVE